MIEIRNAHRVLVLNSGLIFVNNAVSKFAEYEEGAQYLYNYLSTQFALGFCLPVAKTL
jgi:hypothetical protein